MKTQKKYTEEELKEELRKALGMCDSYDRTCSCGFQLAKAMRIIKKYYTAWSKL